MFSSIGGTLDMFNDLGARRATLNDLDFFYFNAGGDGPFPNGPQLISFATKIADEKGKELSPADLARLQALLDKANDPKQTLTAAELTELAKLAQRYLDNLPDSPSEEQLGVLKKILGGINSVVGKIKIIPPFVRKVLELYESIVGSIKDIVTKGIKENEYQTFQQQMGGLEGDAARRRFEEIEGAYRPEFAQQYWLRYQLEMLLAKLKKLKAAPVQRQE